MPHLKISGFIEGCDIENTDNLQCNFCFYAGSSWEQKNVSYSNFI